MGVLAGAAAAIGLGLPKLSTWWTPIRKVNASGPVTLEAPAKVVFWDPMKYRSRPIIHTIYSESRSYPLAHLVVGYEGSVDDGRTWFPVSMRDTS